MKIELLPGERLDELHRKGYYIIQKEANFCFGMDAVLLSDYAKVKPGEFAMDLGCGTGIISILMEAKTEGNHFTGLEIQQDMADMARRSVCCNHLENKITIESGDIKDASARYGASSFHVVTTNPPYIIGNHGLINANTSKAVSRHELLCNLTDVIRESATLLKNKGRFYMVHRPFRLSEIISLMHQYKVEPKRMRLVHPYLHKKPNMVLIEGVKNGNARMEVEPPLIVYNKDGSYTKEIYEIYGYEKQNFGEEK